MLNCLKYLTEEVKSLYIENLKILMKETEKDTREWKDISCSWIVKLNVTKMSILSKEIYRFNAISIKIPMVFSEKKILKFVWNYKRSLISKSVLKNRTNCSIKKSTKDCVNIFPKKTCLAHKYTNFQGNASLNHN